MAFRVRSPPKRRKVQNRITFLPSNFGRLSMNAKVSFAGLPPSTGVPRIKRSQVCSVEGATDVKSWMDAFAASAIAWAKCLVLPVLEK